MKPIHVLIITCLGSLFFFSCTGEKKTPNKFSDETIQRIYNLCDERKGAELASFSKDPNEKYRAEAALAFASIADSAEAIRILPFLEDVSPLVRKNAAYALGQCGNSTCMEEIRTHYLKEQDAEVAGYLIEGFGKIAAVKFKTGGISSVKNDLFFLDTMRFKDESRRVGWAKSTMALHMAGLTEPMLMKRIPFILQYAEHESKVLLAFCMLRYKGVWDEEMKVYLDTWLKSERDVEAKIPMVAMIPKLESPSVTTSLIGYATSTSLDTRVRVSAIRALAKVKNLTPSVYEKIVTDPDPVLVAEALNTMRGLTDLKGMEEVLQRITLSTAEIESLKLRLLHNVKDQSEVLWSSFNSALNAYNKMHFARAMGACPQLHERVFKALMGESVTAVKCALAESYVEMSSQSKWPMEVDFAQQSVAAIQGGDIGVMAIFATALREKSLTESEKSLVVSACEGALNKLVLPREVETYNELVKTIQMHSSSDIKEMKTDFNHPIDWAYAREIDPKQKVRITTTKGDIDMQLHVEDAPGTVVSFLKLTKEGFYNGRFFHRVIPNFVAQGGCPRGDGWGSTDYSLRSEFGLHNYIAGAVGVASSGHDTEGCQWFITLSPAPHLNGRYTIFADVVAGMDVAQRLVVGDGIIKIEMIK